MKSRSNGYNIKYIASVNSTEAFSEIINKVAISLKRTSIFQVITGIFLSLLLLSGCNASKTQTDELRFTAEQYPTVDGSTVTIPLSEALAAQLMDLPIEEARQYVVHNKTHEAYLNLIDKKADIIFVTSPSEEDLKLAKSRNVEFEIVPIVSEAFVFLTGTDNVVDDLTLDEIRKIYSGEITSWKQVGGEDVSIIPYQRPVNSGSQTGLLDLVMKDTEPMEAPTEQVIAGMGELIDTVSAYTDEPNGIGYSYYYYTSEMWGNDRVKLLSVDGIKPEHSSITSGKYPLHTAYYAVINKDEPKNSSARKMISYILSDEGQNLMEEAGYVKVR